MLLMDRETLEPEDFTTRTRSVLATQFKLPAEGLNLEEVERQLVVQALERSGGNQTHAGILQAGIPDWSFNLSDVQVTGNVAHTTHQISGTHTGNLDLSPMGMPVIPATGKSFKLPVEHADLTYEGNKLTRFHADVAAGGGLPGILQQLGVEMPPPG
jgi:hypothetical protein